MSGQLAAAEQDAAAAVACQQAPAGAPAGASVRLLFVLDITGSMSEEIDACKGAMQGVVDMVSTAEDLDAQQLSYAIITFTESDRDGCFTSLFETTSATDAQDHMATIFLNEPPEARGVEAGGDDGPENHKAALARATDLDPSIPTITFLITDAEPHIDLGPPGQDKALSRTAQHELDYLAAKYPALSPADARDFFKTFQNTTLAHFGSNLILNCVVCNRVRSEPSEVQLLFSSIAKQTGGMLMQPESHDADTMAAGLLSVVKALMQRLASGSLLQASAAHSNQQQQEAPEAAGSGRLQLEGFRLIDLAGVNADRSSEKEAAGVVAYGDTEVLFDIALDRMVAVCGKKWTKRAIGMSAPSEQLQLVWRAARYISLCAKLPPTDPAAAAELAASKAEEFSTLLRLRETVLAALPAEARGHLSITEQELRQMGEEAAAWAAAGGTAEGGAVSALSLASVGEALEEEAVWEDWLHSVMKLLPGFPIQVQLPLDACGQPDFMDAWSAVLLRMGVDTITAADFLQLIQSDASARGLTDKRDYNAFLVVPEPTDKLASLVFKVASGTQALDYITSVAMGGKGFLPNLHAGITAACLTQLLSQRSALTGFQWGQVQQLAHGLCLRRANAAKGVTAQLLAGQASPEDNVSKLLLALLRLYKKGPAAASGADAPAASGGGGGKTSPEQLQAALGLVLQEWLGSLMQRHYGKQTPENNSRYYQSVQTYIPVGAVFDSPAQNDAAAGFDPLQQISPLETADASKLTADDPAPAGIRPDWQAAVLKRLSGAHADTPAHPVLGQFLLGAGRLLALLLPPDEPAGAAAASSIKASAPPSSGVLDSTLSGPAIAVHSCWAPWRQAALEALLLRFRTARYTCKAAEPEPAAAGGAGSLPSSAAVPASKPQWEPVQVPSCLVLAVERLQEAWAPELRSFKQARLEEAKQQLLQATADLLKQHAAGEPDTTCAALQQLKLLVRAGEPPEQDGSDSTGAGGPSASLLGHTYRLQRTDVPAVLQLLGAVEGGAQPAQPAPGLPTAEDVTMAEAGSTGSSAVTPGLLRVLVLGPWSTQSAQAFRRNQLVRQLCASFGSECADLLAAITAQQVCARTEGFNRHGHSAGMVHPGPNGWSEEYAAARLAAVAGKKIHQQIKVKTTLEAMQRFTAMAAWARRAAGDDAELAAAVAGVLSQEQDPKQHARVLSKLQRILGQNMPN